MEKNATETYGMLQTAFRASCMNRWSVFEWHKRFREGRESVRDNERCGKSKEVRTPELIGQIENFMDKDRRVSIETISAQIDVSVGTVHTIIREELKMRKICAKFVTDYLTKMGIKTIPQPPYSPYLAFWDFWFFPKLKEKLEAVVMRQLRKGKWLWRRSLTHSHKTTSMGPSRSCWNGTTSALKPEEIIWKGTRVSCVYYQ